MSYRVTDVCAWQLPDGTLVRPGELVDIGSGGITAEQIAGNVQAGYLIEVETTKRPIPAPKPPSMKPKDELAPPE